jgi:hypothetical protein
MFDIYSLQIMSVLHIAEIYLGSIFTWPRQILTYLFIDSPTYLTTLTLLNFFYENGVPLELAVQLYRACNYNATDETVHHFYHYYESWERCEDGIHLGIYYNMKAEKFMYNNGSRRNQCEIVDSLYHDVFTGFGQFDTKALRLKLQHIRTNVQYQI